MYLDNERRPTLTPQLAFRVAVIGGVALMAFAVIFFRLWYLQVLSGDRVPGRGQGQPRPRDQGAGAARRDRRPQRPRARGQPHRPGARDQPGQAARATPASGARSTSGSASCCGMKPGRIERRAERELKARAVLGRDRQAGRRRPRWRAYVLERQDHFPGVDGRAPVRAQVPARRDRRPPVRHRRRGHRGAARRTSATTASSSATASARPASSTQYDRFLRGRNGAAPGAGRRARQHLQASSRRSSPEQGRQLRLSLDLDVQRGGPAGARGRHAARAPSR